MPIPNPDLSFSLDDLRDKSRRILSTIYEPQPEPALDQFTQFAQIDEGLWAWDFTLRDEQRDELASINRRFRGFGREVNSA